MNNPIEPLTLDPQVQKSIIEDRELAFTYTDLIPNSKYPLFEETMLYLFDLIQKVQPGRVLDTGSGLTSILLRKYFPRIPITTVDNNKDWLAKTGELGRRFNTSRHNFILWEDFLLIEVMRKTFDFIIHDLGNMATRLDTLDTVLTYATPKCHILLDNFGIPKYKEYAMRRLTSMNFTPIYPSSPMKLSTSNAGGFAAFVRE